MYTKGSQVRKLAAALGSVTLLAGITLSSSPSQASSEYSPNSPALEAPSAYTAIDSAALDRISDDEEVDPQEILPGATENPAQIDKIVGSGNPAEVVVDFETGEVLAAQSTPEIQTR